MKNKFLLVFFVLFFSCYTINSNAQTWNTKFGIRALARNTGGDANTAFGYYSLQSNTTGSYNTAIGAYTLFYNNGNGNTAIGLSAMANNTIGFNNTACGYSALRSNKGGETNTAVGSGALYNNDFGKSNTAIGNNAMTYNTVGDNNTAIGVRSLSSTQTGSANTACGFRSLTDNKTGSLNIAFGLDADAAIAGDLTNATAIGWNALIARSDAVAIGNSNVVSIGGVVDWSNFADGRYKKSIKENVAGLAFINSLRPVTYTINVKGLNDYYNRGRQLPEEKIDKKNEAYTDESVERAGKITYSGFIAQEVAAAAKKLNYEFSGVDAPENEESLFALRYGTFVVPLVKAVQELSQQNDELKRKYIAKIEALDKEIKELKGVLLSGNQRRLAIENKSFTVLSNSFLEQNIPNPFNHTTTINYTLPQQYSSAKIIITDKSGKTLKEVNVSGSGKGSVQVDASTLANGAYHYSLYVDGKLIDTKQMVLAK